MKPSPTNHIVSSVRVLGVVDCALLCTLLLSSCSVLVDGELEGRVFGGRGDGGSSDDGGSDDDAGRNDGGGGTGGAGGGGSGGGAGGNGGRGGSDATDAGTDVGDANSPAPLTVVSATPADGSSSTYVYANVQVVFSAPVVDVDATQLTVTLDAAPVAGSIDTTENTVTFTPTLSMLSAGTYEVVVAASVAGAGTTLGTDYTFSFSLVPGFPGDAELIDRTDSPGSSDPDVAVDGQGNALAVWLQQGPASADARTAPWYAFYTYGQGWASPRPLDGSSGEAGPPKVAIAPDGTAFVAWTQWSQFANSPATVLVRRYDPVSGWQDAVALDSDPDYSVASQSIAVATNAAGDAVVGWIRGVDDASMGAGTAYVATYERSAGVFSAATPVQTGSAPDIFPVMASGPVEVGLLSDRRVVFGSRAGDRQKLFIQGVGVPESTEVFVEYEYTSVKGMAVAVDPTDVVYGGCHAPESIGTAVARVGATTHFRVEPFNNSAGFDAVDPRVSIGADVDAVAAFLSAKPGTTSVSVQALAFSASEGDWALSAADLFPDRMALVPSAPAVGAYLRTGALILWEAGGDLYRVERDSTGAYSAADRLSNVAEVIAPNSVQVAASPYGTGVIVWQEDNTVTPGRIGAQSFRGAP